MVNTFVHPDLRSLRIRLGPWAEDSRGRIVFQTIQIRSTSCPCMPVDADGIRTVERSAFIENAFELTADQLDSAVSEVWRRRAEAHSAGAPILLDSVCPICACHVPDALAACRAPNSSGAGDRL